MKNKLILLLILMHLVSCGTNNKLKVSGETTHHATAETLIRVDVERMFQDIEDICYRLYDQEIDQDDCLKENFNILMELIDSGKYNNDINELDKQKDKFNNGNGSKTSNKGVGESECS